MDLKNADIVEAGHITEVYGPVQALKNYLSERAGKFIFITHPFSYTGIEGSRVEFYENGKKTASEAAHKRSGSRILQWIKDMLFNLKFLKKRGRTGLFIGVDNLNALAGIMMKKKGKVDRTAYYIIDHMDRRFKNPLFNFIYETIDKIACEKSDYVWALSQRMADAKIKKFGLKGDNFYVVPVGIELEKVDKFTKEEKLSKKTMVLMSMLDETKGVQLLIDAMEDIVKKVPEAELLIIGTGPYENELKKKTALLKLEECVKFMGLMQHDELFKFIPHQRIGLAPYIDDSNNYTWYADPTKPKEYLGCGLPLVITDVPWIAEEVRKRPMGITCRYEKSSIADACVKLLDDDVFYEKCLDNALKFASRLNWSVVYDEVFGKME
ncbi:MAG: glycosyltransferase family 4 protein [Candidatus Goldiibacteriota bacterium]